jgi:aspartate/methionine/tyrosine aminotransferase
MKIRPFAVEQWMNAHETRCSHNLAETCVASLTVEDLLELCGQSREALGELLHMKLTYGAIEGSERLRAAIARLYQRQSPAHVLVAHGAIGANALVYQALVEPRDRVVSIVPNYQQHTSIPESLGASVQRLWLRAEDRFQPDLDELKRLITAGTKLVVFSNPNNPTGALMSPQTLREIVQMAEAVGAYVLSDEVYRGTTQHDDAVTPSIVDLYERGISIGSMSKAFSLAGLRLGWIAGHVDVLKAAEVHRDYNTISVGMLDDHFASLALEHSDQILARSRRIVRANLEILDQWVAREPLLSYVKPEAGTTALVKFDLDLSSQAFCERLLADTGVLFTPGCALEMEGHLRIGYANDPAIVSAGLERTSAFLRTFESGPTPSPA